MGLLWGYDGCGEGGVCGEYDLHAFSLSFSLYQSFGFRIQLFLPRLATLTVLAVLDTLANEFRLTEC